MLLAAALLGLGLTHQAAQRLDTTHVLFAAVVSLGLAPLSLFILLPQSSIGLAGAGARRLCACRYHCRRCPCSSRSLLGLHEQLRRTFSTTEKSSSPEQRLFVGPLDLRRTNYNDTFIYHLMLQLRPATYFSQSTRFTSPRRYRLGGLARSRPELRMSGTNQMRPASSARMHQTKWCDLDLRFAASTEPTCSAVAGKMEAKVTASGAGLLACF